MKSDRRSFLKTSGALGGALLTGTAAGTQLAQAQTQTQPATAAAAARGDMVRGFTFCTLRKGDAMSLGVRTDKGILDVAAAEAALKQGAPTTITAVLAGGNSAALKSLVEKAQPAHFVAENAAAFGPCVTEPEKILCVGLNYRKHAAETNNPVPKAPILFNKFNSALNHHDGEINVSIEKGIEFDYEAELVIVIGKTARNVSEADALNYVFGYCTGNDFTARDLQRQSSQWMLGKSLDKSGPIGPWLVTSDLADGDNLKIECHVNGDVRQSSNTNDMVFNCKQLVSFCSFHFTLKPGDLIFTGTPSGVISGYPKEQRAWLKKGDKVVTTIEKLGALSFTLT